MQPHPRTRVPSLYRPKLRRCRIRRPLVIQVTVLPGADLAAANLPEARRISNERLADLAARGQTARQRETVLWWLFILAFTLTLAVGGASVVLILLGSLKVAMASGAAGLLPGCSSAWLRREGTARGRDRQDIDKERDGELRIQQAVAVVFEFPPGTQKDKIQEDYAKKMLSRIPE